MQNVKITNIAELKTRKGSEGAIVSVSGYYTAGDGGGGNFYWNNTSLDADNSGTVIQVTGVTTGRWIRVYDSILNVKWFGAASNKTDAQNKAIIEACFVSVPDIEVYIPYDLDYGFKRNVKSTFLQFTGVTTYKAVTDYSHDGERDGLGDGTESGSQERRILYTGGFGGTDNMTWQFNARYHPAMILNHNGEDETMLVANGGLGRNRNASVFFGTYGNANWKVGQGGFTGDSYSEAELTPFQIVVNGLPDLGISGLTNVYQINKTDGRMGWNTNAPRYAFDFRSREGQPSANSFGFQTATGYPNFILQSSENASQLQVRVNSTSGVDFYNETSKYFAIESNGTVLRQTVVGTAANIDQFLNTGTYTRRIQVANSNGAYKILTSANGVGIDSNDDGSVRVGGNTYPSTDNTRTLGTAALRWSVVYAGTGTINTSDERLKSNIRDISEIEKEVALKIKSSMKSYKLVEDSSQKIRFGVIAQDVITKFAESGLNALDYGIIQYDEWNEIINDEGIVEVEAGNRYGVNYNELLCFIIAAI